MTRRRFLEQSIALAGGSSTLYGKDQQWQTGEVASMEVIRTPIGKRLVYRYSYAVHANGHTYTFDEKNKLHLTVNGPVQFVVNGDKIRVRDERGKEHHETVLQRAVDKK